MTKPSSRAERRKMMFRWQSMRRRCYEPTDKSFQNYGGRGIVMCDRWLHGDETRSGFECFLEDVGYPQDGQSLDRLDNDGPYSPGNCQWADRKQQNRNTRRNSVVKYKGWEAMRQEILDRYDVNPDTLKTRLRRGWSLPEAIFGKDFADIHADRIAFQGSQNSVSPNVLHSGRYRIRICDLNDVNDEM